MTERRPYGCLSALLNTIIIGVFLVLLLSALEGLSQ